MENDNEKRKRSPNWLPSEKHLLLDLVEEHFGVIENKKTDGVTVKKKLAEWNLMQEKYNSRTVNCSRSASNLRSQWESLKKAARKDAAENKMHMIRTGGGPPKVKKEDVFFLRIMSLIKTTAVGLHNPFDSDNVEASGSQDITDILVENVEITQMEENLDFNMPNELGQKEDLGNAVSEKEDKELDKDWGNYTPRLLQMPISTPLRTQAKNDDDKVETAKRKSWVSKRRPILGLTAPSSLEQLHRYKIDALELQKKLACEERGEMKELNAIELEIKKEKLKQEKINTRILLLDLRLKREQYKMVTSNK